MVMELNLQITLICLFCIVDSSNPLYWWVELLADPEVWNISKTLFQMRKVVQIVTVIWTLKQWLRSSAAENPEHILFFERS